MNTRCFLPKRAIRIYLKSLVQCQLCSFWLQRKCSAASQEKKEGCSWSNTEGICNLWMMAKVTQKACHVPAEIAHAHVLNALKHLLGTFACGQTSAIIKLLSFSWQGRLKTKKRRGEKVEGISASSGDAFQQAWTALHPPWMLQCIPLFPLTRYFLLFSPSVPCKVCFTSLAMWSALHSPCLPALKFPQI